MSINPFIETNPQILELKILLVSLKEHLEILQLQIEARCETIVKSLLIIKTHHNIGDVISKVLGEFSLLSDEIMETRNHYKLSLDNYNQLSIGRVPISSQSDYSQEPSRMSSNVPSRVRSKSVLKSSFADDKKVADSLRSMHLIVEKFEKDNEKLRDDNKRLLRQLHDVIHLNLGIKKEEKHEEKPKHPQISVETCDILNIKEIMVEIRAELHEAFVEFEPRKSISDLLFRDMDKSFNWDESETLEISKEEWNTRLNILKGEADEMRLIDAKLTAIKTVYASSVREMERLSFN